MRLPKLPKIGGIEIRIVKPIEEIKYRKITYGQAKKEIADYIVGRKKKIWTDELIDDLRIDPILVLRALSRLKEEGKIKEVG